MTYLADSNVLLRLVSRRAPLHPDALRAYITLRQNNEELYLTPQNLIEFWAVATQPVSANGLGLTMKEASHESALLKGLFSMKPDISGIFPVWEQLVRQYQVQGKQVHDTRLVAAMIAHGISHLLTFNTDDFKRFAEITALDPRNVN